MVNRPSAAEDFIGDKARDEMLSGPEAFLAFTFSRSLAIWATFSSTVWVVGEILCMWYNTSKSSGKVCFCDRFLPMDLK